MSTGTEIEAAPMDTVKLAAAALLLVAGIGAFYYFGEHSGLLRGLGLLAVAAVAVAIGYTTARGRMFAGFLGDARTEVRKVVWPTRQETVQTTLIVFVMVVLVAIFLWLLDMLLLWGVQLLTGQGG